MLIRSASLLLALAAALSSPASAQDAKVPYWASIRSDEVNMRAGPAEEYRIVWVYKRAQLPLKVLRLKDGWRLVQDPDGTKGWMLSRFLTRARTVYVQGKQPVEMRAAGEAGAQLLWRLSPGLVAQLGNCDAGWCEVTIGSRSGFVRQDRLWGAGNP
jgi:SH3-like domain-containing protein